ncbi:SF3 helicase domain-containing protein [Aphis craccivora]|uniref:SF3 helicase domain-containing protein n=1 Tax=Aphis craccivora TaxID=307492 RepID=A0A6G0YPW2_APHCR|nr:SF3 helicase domain-containing protein [Aphis craccivora]
MFPYKASPRLLTNHYLSMINDPSFKDRLSVYTWIRHKHTFPKNVKNMAENSNVPEKTYSTYDLSSNFAPPPEFISVKGLNITSKALFNNNYFLRPWNKITNQISSICTYTLSSLLRFLKTFFKPILNLNILKIGEISPILWIVKEFNTIVYKFPSNVTPFEVQILTTIFCIELKVGYKIFHKFGLQYYKKLLKITSRRNLKTALYSILRILERLSNVLLVICPNN